MKFLRPGDAEEHSTAFTDQLTDVRDLVAAYLDSAPIVLSTPGGVREGRPWSEVFRCDGEFIWRGSAADAVRSGRVVVPVEMSRRILDGSRPPSTLNEDQVRDAVEAIVAFRSD